MNESAGSADQTDHKRLFCYPNHCFIAFAFLANEETWTNPKPDRSLLVRHLDSRLLKHFQLHDGLWKIQHTQYIGRNPG